jgi:hypothetical protein
MKCVAASTSFAWRPTVTAEKVWISLSFTALIEGRGHVDDHLVSFVRMIDCGEWVPHFVPLVRRNKRCKSWTCHDDDSMSPAVVLKVEDEWLRDTVRMAFHVARRESRRDRTRTNAPGARRGG